MRLTTDILMQNLIAVSAAGKKAEDRQNPGRTLRPNQKGESLTQRDDYDSPWKTFCQWVCLPANRLRRQQG